VNTERTGRQEAEAEAAPTAAPVVLVIYSAYILMNGAQQMGYKK